MIKLWRLILLMTGVGLSYTALAVEADTSTVKIEASPQAARVVSCAIRFPIDSVKFAEDQVYKCMQAVNVEAVSYIHIIATADSTGSSRHNLYLSTRRAGAIEAFLTNRYPHVQIHAFGGGENPKFGKLARIFVVEHQGNAHENTGVQVASIGTPEIIERTKTEYVTKTEYRDRPQTGLGIATHTGPGTSKLSDDVYNYVGFEINQTLSIPVIESLSVGVRHLLLQSDAVRDLNSTSLMLGRDWRLAQVYGHQVYYSQTVDFGRLLAHGQSLEWGAAGTVGLQNKTFKIFLRAGKSNYLTSIGVGGGVRL